MKYMDQSVQESSSAQPQKKCSACSAKSSPEGSKTSGNEKSENKGTCGLKSLPFVYVLGQVEARFPNRSIEKEFVQIIEPTSRSKIISNHPLFWLILGSIIDIMSINARKLSHRFFQLVLAPSYSCSCHVQCANIWPAKSWKCKISLIKISDIINTLDFKISNRWQEKWWHLERSSCGMWVKWSSGQVLYKQDENCDKPGIPVMGTIS